MSALEQALLTRRRGNAAFTATGLVHHTEAGSQYTSLAFTEALLDAGIASSIGSVGDALDNALMEFTDGLFKTELINRQRSWTGRAQVEKETPPGSTGSTPTGCTPRSATARRRVRRVLR
jgi:transposase InsO family protein